MIRFDHSQALFAFLGLGIANLLALNHWALPGMFTETEVNSATDAPPVSVLRPAPLLPAPTPPAAAHVNSVPAAGSADPAPSATASATTEPPATQVTSAEAVVEFQRGT